MAFRINEAIEKGQEFALHRLISSLPRKERDSSESKLLDLIDEFGPVVDAYPCWHPLVSSNYDPQIPNSYPNHRCGYQGLDHTVYLRDAFISCPYGGADEIIESVENLDSRDHLWATIKTEKLNFPLYEETATPVLVKCVWHEPMEQDLTLPKRFAIARILEQEIPGWADYEVGETWETMRTYFLGQPCGARSSLFVNQETGQKMKNVWNAILQAGVFGPIKV